MDIVEKGMGEIKTQKTWTEFKVKLPRFHWRSNNFSCQLFSCFFKDKRGQVIQIKKW